VNPQLRQHPPFSWPVIALAGLLLLASWLPSQRHRPAGAANEVEGTAASPDTQTGQPQSIPDVDVPILMYHYLTDDEIPPTVFYVTRGMFEKQMSALRAYGYDTVSLGDFLDYRESSTMPPDRPVILTFDDGHRSVYTMARPILNSLDMSTTFFITTDFITDTGKWKSITWSEIAQFLGEGHPIESHSVTHARLDQLPVDEAWQEILNSRQEIEDRLGDPAQFFAYPSGMGAYDPVLQDLVQAAGYQAAVAAWPSAIANTATSNLWALPRIRIREAHSVDLDPGRPNDFFMLQVDPDFPIPRLTVGTWLYLSQDGASSGCFAPGEAITVDVVVTNHGDPVTARVVFSLDDDADHDNIYFSQFTDRQLANGESVIFSYDLELDNELSAGLHTYAIDVLDEHAVLGFLHSGWQPALLLSTNCHAQYLPVFHR
jgi:peptidoglycan/xylan/chitin deacetylase (PgdA/CDA1 family)